MIKFWRSKFVLILCLSAVFGLAYSGLAQAEITCTGPIILDDNDFVLPGAWEANGFGECFYLLPGGG